MLGYKKDVHYFIGRRPPEAWRWPEPYEPPLKYDYFISWYNGAGFPLVSQDRPGSGRGLNVDGVIGDEAQLLDEEKLFNDVLATNRGKNHLFKNCPLHHSTFFAFTYPWTARGKWVLKMEEEAKKNPKEIFYLRASAMENMKNLGPKWFKDMRRYVTDLIYNAEILNVRPDRIEGGFYSRFDEKVHCYKKYNYSFIDNLRGKNEGIDVDLIKVPDSRFDGDVMPNEPLDIAFDYGAAINCLVCAQESDRFRFLKSFFVKRPMKINDVVKMFCKYYYYHKNKTVIYYYDHTAIGTDGRSTTTYKDEVIREFIKEGWAVVENYIGQAPGHNSKYLLWNALLSGDDRLPLVGFNEDNCEHLIISIKHAPMKEGYKGPEKDKSSEDQRKKTPQESATHLSDAGDTLAYGKLSNRMRADSTFVDNQFL